MQGAGAALNEGNEENEGNDADADVDVSADAGWDQDPATPAHNELAPLQHPLGGYATAQHTHPLSVSPHLQGPSLASPRGHDAGNK
jgi:hypothetical protein